MVRLAYREPFPAKALLGFLGQRTIAGVDEVVGDTYRRGMLLAHGPVGVAIRFNAGHASVQLDLADERDLSEARARCRALLDLDADPVAIDAALARDPLLHKAITEEPGLRVPGAVDGFEIAVRAIVGQQISVAGARTVLARLVAASWGAGTVGVPGLPQAGVRGFPPAEAVAEAPDEAFGMPVTRRATIRRLATEVASGRLRLDPAADHAQTRAHLLAIPGIGPWTVQYVSMRALHDPDVLLPTDLGVRRGANVLGLPTDPVALAAHAERHWAPWRSYATVRLWRFA